MNTSEQKISIDRQGKWNRKKVLRNIILFVVTVLWFGTMARFGFDAHHDGIMLGAAAAVAEGKLIFKEVFSQYGPLTIVIQSIPVWIFGAEDLVIKFTTVFFYGLIAVLGTEIWERFLQRPFLWVWYGCFFLLCPFYLVPFHPWSSVYALFFMLLGLEGQLRFLEKEESCWLWLSGACAACAFLCRTPCGIVAFAAGAVLLMLKGYTSEAPGKMGPLCLYTAGAGVIALLFALYLTCAGAWSDYLRQCFTFIFGFVVSRGGSWSWSQFADSMLPLTGASGFGNCIFALLPFLAIGAFMLALRPLFYHRKEQLKNNLPLLAAVMLALGSWHQYFPVPCVRHLYWAAVPAFGIFALTAQGIWSLSRPRALRIGMLLLLAVPLIYCANFRLNVLVRYFEKLHTRMSATAPGIRGTWIFKGEAAVFNTLHTVFSSLPPEIRARGVLNHTPDGIYSALFPSPVGFRHPMFVNWGTDVYPDYHEAVMKHLKEKRCAVLTTEFTELPGYDIAFSFTHFERPFRLFVPLN